MMEKGKPRTGPILTLPPHARHAPRGRAGDPANNTVTFGRRSAGGLG